MKLTKNYGVYLTASGKDALRIDKITDCNGGITFSYIGVYGAGSGASFNRMADIIRDQKKRHPSMRLTSGLGFVAGEPC